MGITKLALERLDGIIKTRVSLDLAQAMVIYDPARVTPEEMAAAINEGTDFMAGVISVEAAQPGAGEEEECLILGFFCD